MQPRSWYALFMLLALTVFLVARRLQPRVPALEAVPWWKRGGLVLAGFIGGALGAKVPFVLGGSLSWFSPVAWIGDGKTVTTALLGAYLGIEVAKLALGIKAKTGDSFAVPLALALAVGRWGCFFNGCCYGVETTMPWGIDFGDGVGRHPTQIYEVLFHLTMAIVLVRLTQLDVLRCQRLKFYLIGYGIYRFITEFIRPEPREWLGLTFYQGIAIVLVVVLSVQWVIDERAKPRQRRQLPERSGISPPVAEMGPVG
jgi:prolipoprotein diacylglyceryltransferase